VFLLTTSLLPDARQFIIMFRREVDKLLEDDKKLESLLTWADKKSVSIQANPWLVRPKYLFIEVYYRRNIMAGLELDWALDRARANAHPHNPALQLDLVLAITLDGSYGLRRARGLNLSLYREPDLDLPRKAAFLLARTSARELGFDELAEELDKSSIPLKETSETEWQEFAKRLQVLMIQHRDIGHDWDLTRRQETLLADYLDATGLLQDCLELAFMPPDEKKAMLNRLYLPPAQAADEQDA
jgi:hypothetical protein